jgi:hypothetical protein
MNTEFTTRILVDVGGSAIASYGLIIDYDANALTAVSVADGGIGIDPTENLNNPGRITVAGFDANGKTGTNLIDIVWRAGSTAGSSQISITVDTLTDANYNSLGNTGQGATVTITDVRKGDVNDDGNITIVDALMVAQFYVGLPVTINQAAADTNCDGNITIVDALRIAQYYVGLLASLDC